MTKSVIQGAISWLNAFPSENELSDTLCTDEIVQGLNNPNYDKLTIDFISYTQVHTGTYNTTKSRMIVTISLQSDKEHNVYYFMSLETIKKFHAFNWTEWPINDYVINRVEEMTRYKNQPIMANGYPKLKQYPGVPILGNNKYENEIADIMEQVAYYVTA